MPNKTAAPQASRRSVNRGTLTESLGAGGLPLGINCAIQVGVRFPHRRLNRSPCPPLRVASVRSPTRYEAAIAAKIVGVSGSAEQRSGSFRRLLSTRVRRGTRELQDDGWHSIFYDRASWSFRTTRSWPSVWLLTRYWSPSPASGSRRMILKSSPFLCC